MVFYIQVSCRPFISYHCNTEPPHISSALSPFLGVSLCLLESKTSLHLIHILSHLPHLWLILETTVVGLAWVCLV